MFEPGARTDRSYTAPGIVMKAPPALYAIDVPTATESPVTVFFAHRVIGLEFEIALTNRTVATEKSIAAGKASSMKKPSTVFAFAS